MTQTHETIRERSARGAASASPRRDGAFTLAEVMFAMLILGIGLIAIASMFPVAGTIQRLTVEQVMGQNVARSAESTLLGKGIPLAFANTNMPKVAGDTTKLVPQLIASANLFPMADRSFPMSEPTVAKRSYYWVPLYRWDATKTQYQFFIFVMQTVGGEAPSDALVTNASAAPNGSSNAGDMVVDNNGIISQRTSDATNESRWHGVASGPISRSLQLIPMGPGIVQ